MFAVQGMHIGDYKRDDSLTTHSSGAHESPDNSNQWIWSDGEVPINGAAYNNFISCELPSKYFLNICGMKSVLAFPIPGAGSCVAMMTDNPSAFWINEDCQRDPLPFMCRRIGISHSPFDRIRFLYAM